MKKILSSLFMGLLAAFGVQAQSGLVITEISYNPPESGTDSLEFIEIYNNSGASIDLQGYYITFAGNTVRDSFASSFVLPAGGIVVTAVNDSAVFRQFGMTSLPRRWRAGGGLSNTSTNIKLYNASAQVVDSVAYANSWVTGTNGLGASMILCDVNSDNNVAASWSISRRTTGNTIGSLPPIPLVGSPGILETCPPVNDNCGTAIPLLAGTSCNTTNGTLLGATQSQAGCVGTADDDVWYQFVASTTSGSVTVEGNGDLDMVVEVFSGACGSLVSMNCVDDEVSGVAETVNLTGLTVGTTYYVRVYDYYDAAVDPPSDYTFTICVQAFNSVNCSNFSVTLASTNGNCSGQGGSITATVSNGSAPIGYLWNDFATTQARTGLDAGTYSVTVGDVNFCTATASATVSGGAGFSAFSASATDASGAGVANGDVTTTATGGLAPFVYLWSNGATTADLNGVVPASYSVTITDANGCSSTASATVGFPSAVSALQAGATYSLQPNPAREQATLVLNLVQAEQVRVELWSLTGQRLYAVEQMQAAGEQVYALPVADLASGVYVVRLTGERGQSQSIRLTVGR